MEQEPELVPERHGLAGVEGGLVDEVEGLVEVGHGGLPAWAIGDGECLDICVERVRQVTSSKGCKFLKQYYSL